MTLDEAIEVLETEQGRLNKVLDYVQIAALRLGVEALKEKRQTRYASHRTEYDLLPGETEK